MTIRNDTLDDDPFVVNTKYHTTPLKRGGKAMRTLPNLGEDEAADTNAGNTPVAHRTLNMYGTQHGNHAPAITPPRCTSPLPYARNMFGNVESDDEWSPNKRTGFTRIVTAPLNLPYKGKPQRRQAPTLYDLFQAGAGTSGSSSNDEGDRHTHHVDNATVNDASVNNPTVNNVTVNNPTVNNATVNNITTSANITTPKGLAPYVWTQTNCIFYDPTRNQYTNVNPSANQRDEVVKPTNLLRHKSSVIAPATENPLSALSTETPVERWNRISEIIANSQRAPATTPTQAPVTPPRRPIASNSRVNTRPHNPQDTESLPPTPFGADAESLPDSPVSPAVIDTARVAVMPDTPSRARLVNLSSLFRSSEVDPGEATTTPAGCIGMYPCPEHAFAEDVELANDEDTFNIFSPRTEFFPCELNRPPPRIHINEQHEATSRLATLDLGVEHIFAA